MIDATHDLVCAYKINLAFYEAMGDRGWPALRRTIALIPAGILVIGDAKRGDIGNPAEMYAGCVARALEREKYMELIAKMGFINITIHKEKEIFIPDIILAGYLTGEEIEAFRTSGTGVFSITISGEKPAKGCVCCGT